MLTLHAAVLCTFWKIAGAIIFVAPFVGYVQLLKLLFLLRSADATGDISLRRLAGK
jgi:hypothetical protein